MKFLYLCNQHRPECANSWDCGVNCTHTTDPKYSEYEPNPPKDFEDLEERFTFVDNFCIDGKVQTVWEEKQKGVKELN